MSLDVDLAGGDSVRSLELRGFDFHAALLMSEKISMVCLPFERVDAFERSV